MYLQKCFARCISVLALGLFAVAAQADANSNIKGAPDFTLKSNSGENIRLAEARGQVVMLNFWATWCGPCRVEMPLLEAMHQRYSAAGFTLYGINVEEDSEGAAKLAKTLGLSFPILFDTESKASTAYGVEAMPTTVLIDKQGQIRYVHRGYKEGDENIYREKIRELIKE